MAKRRKKKAAKRPAKKRAKKKGAKRGKKAKPNTCKDCGKVCKSASGLSSHRRMHSKGPDSPTQKKAAFLESMCELGNVTLATQAAKVRRQQPYEWAQADPKFAKAWTEAREHASDLLEEEARRRAVVGTLKPVYQGGKKVGSIRQFSDTLLIFLLNGQRPEKYRRHSTHEHTGKGGGPIQTEPAAPKEDLSPKELEELRALTKSTGVN